MKVNKFLIILCLTFIIQSMSFAQSRRIVDDDGDELDINPDGSITVVFN